MTTKRSRTQSVLSASAMRSENFPSSSDANCVNLFASPTLSDASPMFAIDCEMVETTTRTRLGEVAHIVVVDENHRCVLRTYVKPKNAIVDYRTRFSGISKSNLVGVTTELEDVQRQLREILPSNAILVGHALQFDMNALKLIHPHVIDSAILYGGTRRNPQKLRDLAKKLLNNFSMA